MSRQSFGSRSSSVASDAGASALGQPIDGSRVVAPQTSLLVCGADISARSPALAVYMSASNAFTVYYFGQTHKTAWLHGTVLGLRSSGATIHLIDITRKDAEGKRHGRSNLRGCVSGSRVKSLDNKSRGSSERLIRGRIVSLVDVLEEHVALNIPPKVPHTQRQDPMKVVVYDNVESHRTLVHVGIEGYAYALFGRSASVSTLCEATGVFKYLLERRGIDYSIVPPTAAKREFAATGKATKQDMLATFLDMTYPSPLHTYVRQRSNASVSPLADIVDAFAILQYQLAQMQPNIQQLTPLPRIPLGTAQNPSLNIAPNT